jgi:hypothetical protein
MKFIYNDGGRAAAGYKGHTGDCVARAIAIASGLPYQQVYDRLAEGNATQRKGKYENRREKRTGRVKAGASGKKTAAHGINVRRKWFKDYMHELGFEWVATMGIGTGCNCHLKEGELPMGRLVVQIKSHYAAVIDGVLHDTYNRAVEKEWAIMRKDGFLITGRSHPCVYGYWILKNAI